MRRLLSIACALTVLLVPSVSFGADSWVEEFKDTSRINLSETDAYVYINPAGGYAELPSKGRALLELKEETFDKVVLSADGMEYFMFDGAGLIKNPDLSYQIQGSSIAVRQDAYSAWIATDKEVFRLEFDGTGMVENPFLKITGRKNILAISSQPYDDELAVLLRAGDGGALIEYHTLGAGGTMESSVSFEADAALGSPVDIAFVPGTMDIVYATETAVIFYNFTGSGFVQNPMLSVTGLSNIKALSVHDGGYAILRANRKEHYLFTGTEMAYVEGLSRDLPAGTLSVRLRPGEYDFAAVRDDGQIDYYMFDGTGYALNPALGVRVNLPAERYHTPRRYVSRPINLAQEARIFRLSVNETRPAGTDIKYFILSGGVEREITPGTPLAMPGMVQSVILIAEMSTTGRNTPRITRMQLDAIRLGVETIKVDMFPIHDSFAPLPRPFVIYPDFPPGYGPPIPTQIGSVVVFELEALGTPETVTMELGLWRSVLLPVETVTLTFDNLAGGIWGGVLNVPGDINTGARYSIRHVVVTGGGNTATVPASGAMHDPFLVIVDELNLDLLNFINVYLTR